MNFSFDLDCRHRNIVGSYHCGFVWVDFVEGQSDAIFSDLGNAGEMKICLRSSGVLVVCRRVNGLYSLL